MDMPSVVHPVKFEIKGITFEVVSIGELTNEQAAGVARLAYAKHKRKKKDVGKIVQVVTFLDGDSLEPR